MAKIKANRAVASAYSRYHMKTPLQLPFDGTWFVVWGGRSLADNRHAVVQDQRFAYDFVIVMQEHTYANEGRCNEDYFCLGEIIRAPAGGEVVAAEALVPDNSLGQMNVEQPLGNHVIIDHGCGEYSFLAHLKYETVCVTPRQIVSPGDIIGACGNSGRSTQPHLHFHVQTTMHFQKGFGLPAPFNNFYVNGRFVQRGIPRRGGFVSRSVK